MGKLLKMHNFKSNVLVIYFSDLSYSSLLVDVRKCVVHLHRHTTNWFLNCLSAATSRVNLSKNLLNTSHVATIITTLSLILIDITADQIVEKEVQHNNVTRLTYTTNSGSGRRSCSSRIRVTVKLCRAAVKLYVVSLT